MNVDIHGAQFYTKIQLIRGILTNMSIDDPIEFLKDQFLNRREKNPSYSLRAFASKLGIPAGRLSELFSRKRKLTYATAKKIAERLELNPIETTKFLQGLNSVFVENDLTFLKSHNSIEVQKHLEPLMPERKQYSGESCQVGILKTVKVLRECQANEHEAISIAITINPQKVHQAKDMIQKFQKEFVDIFDDENHEDEYILNIQFLPFSK